MSGIYWEPKNKRDRKKVLHLYGETRKTGEYTLELPTIECVRPFDAKNPQNSKTFESTRWFVPK